MPAASDVVGISAVSKSSTRSCVLRFLDTGRATRGAMGRHRFHATQWNLAELLRLQGGGDIAGKTAVSQCRGELA